MDKIKINYITGNKLKVDILSSLLNKDEFEVAGKKIEVPEIQADDIKEVAKFSAKYASDLLKINVLKNDSGLVIPALNGFPSAYSKYVIETLSEDGLIKLMEGKTDRSAYYLDAFAYCEYGKEPVVFISKTYGSIAEKPSGENGSGFDKIFIAKGYDVPMAHLEYDEFLQCFDDTGVIELANYLQSK